MLELALFAKLTADEELLRGKCESLGYNLPPSMGGKREWLSPLYRFLLQYFMAMKLCDLDDGPSFARPFGLLLLQPECGMLMDILSRLGNSDKVSISTLDTDTADA